ncbi:hypothetical protein [Streptomyces sp. NPDC047706]
MTAGEGPELLGLVPEPRGRTLARRRAPEPCPADVPAERADAAG